MKAPLITFLETSLFSTGLTLDFFVLAIIFYFLMVNKWLFSLVL